MNKLKFQEKEYLYWLFSLIIPGILGHYIDVVPEDYQFRTAGFVVFCELIAFSVIFTYGKYKVLAGCMFLIFFIAVLSKIARGTGFSHWNS